MQERTLTERPESLPTRQYESYYYSVSGSDVNGPVTRNVLEEMFAAGSLPPDSHVCVEGEED